MGSADVDERPLFGSDSGDLFISTLDIEAMAASPVVLVTGASRGVFAVTVCGLMNSSVWE